MKANQIKNQNYMQCSCTAFDIQIKLIPQCLRYNYSSVSVCFSYSLTDLLSFFSFFQPDIFSDTLSLHSIGTVSDTARSMGGDSVRSMSGEAVKGVSSDGVTTKHKKAKGFRKGKSEKKNKDSSTSVSKSP